MSAEAAAEAAPAETARALRRLFLTLFLRGRTSRGLRRSSAPRSVGAKLFWTLTLYTLVGASAFAFWGRSLFVLSASLHAMTFLFLGMFVAASGGEVLFNEQEAEILLHRPVAPRSLLWAKIRVLVEVSLWLSAALNLSGFIAGVAMPGGSWLFLISHAVSVTLEALFCTGCVVVVYQLCLRWFGRERLDGLMTTAQVLVAMSITLGGQVVPQLIARFGGTFELNTGSWWLGLLPPIWFAALDDAVAGGRALSSWALAALGALATAGLLALSFGRLARDYEQGLQALGETQRAPSRGRAKRRWFDRLVQHPPLSWWLRDSVVRAAFLLTAAYLVRDREVKLRVYPGLAPILAMPLVFLLRGGRQASGAFAVAFSGAFLGLVPALALGTVRYSQHWQASDVFRAAPMAGPAQLCQGARRAVMVVFTAPVLCVFLGIVLLARAAPSDLMLLLPGLLLLPLQSLYPCLTGEAVPLSMPSEEAKAAARGYQMALVMVVSFGVCALGLWARSGGWFWRLVAGEAAVVCVLYVLLRVLAARVRWPSME
jgi:hypothetical protein